MSQSLPSVNNITHQDAESLYMNIQDFRTKLIDKIIIHADSAEDVSRVIRAAARGVKANGVHGHLIVRVMEKLITELEEIKLLNREAQLQINFEEAVSTCESIRQEISQPALS